MINDNEYKLKSRIIIAVVITIVLLSTLFYKTAFVNFVNFNTKITNYENNIYVNYIDVGQGKAIAIRLDDGKSVLIDCGSNYERTKFFNYFNDKFITSNTYQYLDYLILTHTDTDHIGNTIELLKKYEIKNIFLPAYCEEFLQNNTYSFKMNVTLEFISAIKKEKANIFYNSSSQKIVGENYLFTFLAPLNDNYDNINDYSAVIKFEYANKKFLFTGDIGLSVEEQLLSKYNAQDLKVDVLDVTHHGSKYGSGIDFLNVVKPEYAVICVGKNNYNQPNEEVLQRLGVCGVEDNNIMTTLDSENIVFNVNSYGEITVNTIKYCYSLKTNYAWWQMFVVFEVLSIVFIFTYSKFGAYKQKYKH